MSKFLKGYGSGSGSGSGYSEVYGSGYGSGEGYGGGSGSGSKIKILTYKEQKTENVDGMPCVIEKEHTNFAKVSVISKKDFSARPAFLAKFNNTIAHGETITEAMLEAKRKFMSNADFSEQKKLLLSLFEEKKRLTVKDLSEWHGAITGSCSFGRREFQSEHNLKDEDLLSLDEFVELVKDSYGGNKIADLIKD